MRYRFFFRGERNGRHERFDGLQRPLPDVSRVAFGLGKYSFVSELRGGTFDGFGVVGKAACFVDPFVEVSKVDDFVAAFGHLIEEPLPQFSGGGGESVLYAVRCVFFRPKHDGES